MFFLPKTGKIIERELEKSVNIKVLFFILNRQRGETDLKGEELEMLSRHDKQINDEIIPKLTDHEQKFLAHEERMVALERGQKEYKLEMGKVTNSVDAIKNSQDNLKDTLINTSTRQEDRLDKILDLTFNIKEKQVEAESVLEQSKISADQNVESAKISANEKVTVAKFTARQQIILGLVGVGGLSGFITGLSPYFHAVKWPWE